MRTCTVDGCDRKHVARGLCSSHYNKANYTAEQRHPKRRANCTACGKGVLKHHNGSRYRPVCSSRCRYFVTFGRWPETGKELIGPLPKDRALQPPILVIPSSGRVFTTGACGWCGNQFVQNPGGTWPSARYCSRRCSRARQKRARKASEHGALGTYTLGELVRVWLLFDRCCAYCEQPTDGLPDPDHVNPLSRGGSNSITNILPACRICNADKNDMSLTEWAAYRERCGKEPRTTTWDEGDRRVAHLVLSEPTRASRRLRRAA